MNQPTSDNPKKVSSSSDDVDTKTIIGEHAVTEGQETQAGLPVGTQIGKYEIRRQLGVGGMGAVYLAFDPLIEREVAVKILSPSLGESSAALQRFLQEARSIGRLNHPNVVAIFEIDQWNGQYYIVMELLSGGSLSQLLSDRGPLPWKEACRIAAQAAAGLGAAHEAGMVHRDIKPENLMLTKDGHVKVVDFGLSKLVDEANDTRSGVTKAGQILGTPQYMSPEQFESGGVDLRTDIYSLGATLYRLLTNRFPFQECASIIQVMTAHLTKPVPSVLDFDSKFPPECDRIIAKSMAKQQGDRYQTAEELEADLTALIHQGTVQPKTPDDEPTIDDIRPLRSAVVIEPSKMQAAILSDALTRVGTSNVARMQTVADAMPEIQSHPPDLLVTANQLPDGEALDVISTLSQQRILQRSCVVLNSSDSTLEDLISAGRAASLILARKKSRADDILRVVHASGPVEITEGPIATQVDPLGVRLIVVTDFGKVPGHLEELIRQARLLDVAIRNATDTSAFPTDDVPTVVLLLRTAGSSARDDLIYAGMATGTPAPQYLTAAVQVDSDVLYQRSVFRQGVTAVGCRVLDTSRLMCLLQACRAS